MEDNLVDTLDVWLQARLEEMHTTMPGLVQSYDPKTRLATVVPAVRLRSLHGELLEIKPIPSVPVVWPGSNRFSVIPAALVPGDGVLLHFSEASIGNWLQGAGVADAEDETRFSLHDCIAVPGLWQTAGAPKTQQLGTADFGLVGSLGEVLGGKGGKVDIHNQVTTLRARLEAILDVVQAMNTAIGASMLTMPYPPAVPYQSQGTNIAKTKASLKGLLQ